MDGGSDPVVATLAVLQSVHEGNPCRGRNCLQPRVERVAQSRRWGASGATAAAARCIDEPQRVPPPPRGANVILTAVFDFDNTLVDTVLAEAADCGGGDTVFVRAHARCTLAFCASLAGVEVIGWSAGDRSHVERIADILDPARRLFAHVVCRGTWYFTNASFNTTVSRSLAFGVKEVASLPGRCRSGAAAAVLLFDDSLVHAEASAEALASVAPFRCVDCTDDDDTLVRVQLAVQVVRDVAACMAAAAAGPPPPPPCYADLCRDIAADVLATLPAGATAASCLVRRLVPVFGLRRRSS
jgi:hypothetical protein